MEKGKTKGVSLIFCLYFCPKNSMCPCQLLVLLLCVQFGAMCIWISRATGRRRVRSTRSLFSFVFDALSHPAAGSRPPTELGFSCHRRIRTPHLGLSLSLSPYSAGTSDSRHQHRTSTAFLYFPLASFLSSTCCCCLPFVSSSSSELNPFCFIQSTFFPLYTCRSILYLPLVVSFLFSIFFLFFTFFPFLIVVVPVVLDVVHLSLTIAVASSSSAFSFP